MTAQMRGIGVSPRAGAQGGGPRAWVPPERRRVGMVFQDYALFPHLRIADNIAFGLQGASRSDRAARLDELARGGGKLGRALGDAVREESVQPGEPMTLRPEAGVQWVEITSPKGGKEKLERGGRPHLSSSVHHASSWCRVARARRSSPCWFGSPAPTARSSPR
jgi:hypothetical protein